MKFCEKLKLLREERGMSLAEFANLLHSSKQVLSRYERGENDPKLATVIRYAGILNVPLAYLIYDDVTDRTEPGRSDVKNAAANSLGYDSLYEAYQAGIDINRRLPNLRPIRTKRFRMLGEIACGKPIYADEDHESYVDASDSIDADFCLTAKGDSMSGARINDGDVVFIKEQPIVRNGEIAAVVINDEATLKIWYFDEQSKKLVLSPANQAYQPLVYVGDELNSIICLGKAVCFMSNL